MFGQGPVGRQVGVVAPSARPDDAPSQKLLNFQPCFFAAVEYGDAQGQKHTNVLLHMGGQWYMPPNGETWAQSLRPVADWLTRQLNQEFSKVETKGVDAAASVPATDAVDVFPPEKKGAA